VFTWFRINRLATIQRVKQVSAYKKGPFAMELAIVVPRFLFISTS